MSESKEKNIDPKILWKTVLAELEVNLSPTFFQTYLKNTRIVTITNDVIEIAFMNTHSKTQVDKKIKPILQESINRLAKGTYTLEFTVSNQITTTTEMGPLFESEKAKQTITPVTKDILNKAGLTYNYTFDTYIQGKSNNLAYAIAYAVAEKPGENYNPVFLYSGVGLGKTHLLQAIGNKILKEKPNLKVLYTTCESFTNELIESIQRGKAGKYTSNQFRQKYRDIDVLLIDDIQFIVGKEATQDEFFHTFNTLYMAKKQIVLTSDRPPRDFKSLEKRITSRFESGVIADIQAPDLEMRMAILRSKRDVCKDNLPNEVIDYIAEKIATNIRELEGAYTQVVSYIKTMKTTPNWEVAAHVLGHKIVDNNIKQVNFNQILKAVCNYYSIKSGDIKGKSRTKDIVLPRQVAMYLLYELTSTPFMSIGELLGGRDHTTIMHGVKKIQDEIIEVGKTRQDIANIKHTLYNTAL